MSQRELTFSDYLAMVRRHWVLVLVLALVGPALGYTISKFLPSRYKSSTLVLVDQPSVPTNFIQPVDTTDVNERLASMRQEILSRSRLEPIIRQYGLFQSDMGSYSMDDLVARLQAAIDVTPVLPMAVQSRSSCRRVSCPSHSHSRRAARRRVGTSDSPSRSTRRAPSRPRGSRPAPIRSSLARRFRQGAAFGLLRRPSMDSRPPSRSATPTISLLRPQRGR